MKRDYRDSLTNESLQGKFKSQFELVRHAIKIAEHAVRAGHGERPGSQNLAFQILQDISSGRDIMDEDDDEPAEVPVIVETPKKGSGKKK